MQGGNKCITLYMAKRNRKVRRSGEGKINLPQSPVGGVCTRGPKPSAFIKNKKWQTSLPFAFPGRPCITQ